ncbi:MAG: aryl-sulfate sulfotransferase [Phycisphaerales bacterium]|nr:aryl-sulfate sulfotransferase [Phycisphaerales bacterium]
MRQTTPRLSVSVLLTMLTLLLALGSPARADDPWPQWTLFAPTSSTTTYLIDLAGVVRHTWPSAYRPGQAVYLLEGGDLLRTCNDTDVAGFQSGGRGGRLERIAWDGSVEWSYLIADADQRQHHDALPMPNGHILAVVWERKTAAQAVGAGRNPALISGGEIWSEMLLEINPTGPTTGDVVWTWHVWDHLVQDFDAAKPNYAPPGSRPGRVNINYTGGPVQQDWLHINAVDYDRQLDQIILSVHNFDEVWIISHAPGSSGDLLYRWGNPAAYGLGAAADQRLFGQHNAQWIRGGLPGAGRLLIYNNGLGRPSGAYSSIEELVPPIKPDGTYARMPGQPFGPAAPDWLCDSASGTPFYSSNISGAQRLPNGNTLVCVGATGRFIELDADCRTVWEYANTFGSGGSMGQAVFRATRLDQHDPRLAGLLWCPADLNDDGLVDFADYLEFLNLFDDSDPRADLNGDGVVDFGDYLEFLNHYDAGC